jgi:hypothetical protein
MNDFFENLIWHNDLDNNHYFTFTENNYTGIVDSHQNVIIPPNYLTILETSIINSEKAGWASRPYKHFLILENAEKKWSAFTIKKGVHLAGLFVKIRIINNTFYFLDTNEAIWTLDYYSEDFKPANYDSINHAFRHNELDQKRDVVFKKYADKYANQFISQFVDTASEKELIKLVCYNSIENPFIIHDHIETWIDENENNTADTIILLKYLESVILSNKASDKKIKLLLEDTQKKINETVL